MRAGCWMDAASRGLLPEEPPSAAAALISDVVLAQEAARSGTLTPQIVIAFWISYGRLAHLMEPVTAASLAACTRISWMGMKFAYGLAGRGDHCLLDLPVHEHRDTERHVAF